MWTRWNFPKTKLSFQILFNLVLWGLWIGLPLFSPVHQEHEVQHPHPHASSEFSEHIIHELLTIIPLFYVITLLLFPYVFRKKGHFHIFHKPHFNQFVLCICRSSNEEFPIGV